MGPGDLIFAIGTNTTECHPIISLGMLKAKEQGAKIIVADPREIELVRFADIWLRHKSGTDVALLNGMMNVILNEGLADEEFIAERTENFAAFKEEVMKYTPEIAAKITTVPEEKIREAAIVFGESLNAAIYYTMGITQHTSGVDNVCSCANLAMLTGNMGKPKGGVNPLRGQNNVQGACDMGALPNVFTAYQSVTVPENRKKFEKAWNVSLSERVGYTIPDVLEAISEDKVKALYVFGENPLRSDPDVSHVKHCLHHVDFLVVQDIFLTETARMADVVLPGATFAEKDGTFSNTERRVQRVRKAVEPYENTKPDWQILTELIRAMDYPAPYEKAEDIFNEMRMLTPSYTGITYERLEKGGIAWPCPNEEHPGTPILHIGKFSRGLGHFVPVAFREAAELPDEEYPLLLSTGRVAAHYHTGTMTRHTWGLDGVCPEELLEVHPDDAAALNIVDGERVKISTRRGSVETRVQVTKRVPRGMTFITFHFTESPGNMLTNPALDPVCKTPEYKVCAAKIEKLTEE